MTAAFKIRIRSKEFVLGERMDGFQETGKAENRVPLDQFKYKDGNWFILWNKETDTCYDSCGQIADTIPLSVEWVQAAFPENKPSEKEVIDLVILLSEAIRIVRRKGKMKGSDKLKKLISQFNAE